MKRLYDVTDKMQYTLLQDSIQLRVETAPMQNAEISEL